MKFNRKNHKNNQNRKNHKKANNIPLFKFEPLEERLMLSATAAEWQTEINDIASAYHFSMDNTFTQTDTIGGLYNVDAQTGVLSLAKLSDVIKDAERTTFHNQLTSVITQAQNNLETAVSSLKFGRNDAYKISASEIHSYLSQHNLADITNSQNVKIAEITLQNANTEAEALELSVNLTQEIAKKENQSLIASLYDLPENALNLHVNLAHLNSVLEYNLAVKLNGKDNAETTIENLNVAAQFRQVTAENDNNASYGALGLESLPDAENDDIIPDLKLGLSQDLVTGNSEVKQQRWADLNFAVELAA